MTKRRPDRFVVGIRTEEGILSVVTFGTELCNAKTLLTIYDDKFSPKIYELVEVKV